MYIIKEETDELVPFFIDLHECVVEHVAATWDSEQSKGMARIELATSYRIIQPCMHLVFKQHSISTAGKQRNMLPQAHQQKYERAFFSIEFLPGCTIVNLQLLVKVRPRIVRPVPVCAINNGAPFTLFSFEKLITQWEQQTDQPVLSQ